MTTLQLTILLIELFRYEPSLFNKVCSLTLTATEAVRMCGWHHFLGRPNIRRTFRPSVVWSNYDASGIIAGPCKQTSADYFSFLINGPKFSSSYKHFIKVSIPIKYLDLHYHHLGLGLVTLNLKSLEVSVWPNQTNLYHANIIDNRFIYKFKDLRFLPTTGTYYTGMYMLAIATRISVLLHTPEPIPEIIHEIVMGDSNASINGYTGASDVLRLINNVHEYQELLWDHQECQEHDGFESNYRRPPRINRYDYDSKYRASLVWYSCNDLTMSEANNCWYDYYSTALGFTEPKGYRYPIDDYLPLLYLPPNKYKRSDLWLNIYGCYPNGVKTLLKNVFSVYDARFAAGKRSGQWPWTLISIVFNGRCLGYDNPDESLYQQGVRENDTVFIEVRNAMPIWYPDNHYIS